MENKEYQCLRCRSVLYSSIKCHVCGSLELVRLPTTAVDELGLDQMAETTVRTDKELSNKKEHMIALYYYKKGYTDHAQAKQSKVVELIEAYKREFKGYEISNDESFAEAIHNSAMLILTDLLTKLKQ